MGAQVEHGRLLVQYQPAVIHLCESANKDTSSASTVNRTFYPLVLWQDPQTHEAKVDEPIEIPFGEEAHREHNRC